MIKLYRTKYTHKPSYVSTSKTAEIWIRLVDYTYISIMQYCTIDLKDVSVEGKMGKLYVKFLCIISYNFIWIYKGLKKILSLIKNKTEEISIHWIFYGVYFSPHFHFPIYLVLRTLERWLSIVQYFRDRWDIFIQKFQISADEVWMSELPNLWSLHSSYENMPASCLLPGHRAFCVVNAEATRWVISWE